MSKKESDVYILYHATTEHNLNNIKNSKVLKAKYPQYLGSRSCSIKNIKGFKKWIARKFLRCFESRYRILWLSTRQDKLDNDCSCFIELKITNDDFKKYIKRPYHSCSGMACQLRKLFCSTIYCCHKSIYFDDYKEVDNKIIILARFKEK